MKRKLEFWIDEGSGLISDKSGSLFFLPQKAEAADGNPQYIVEGGLDMSGSITLTGNLTVQQSDWVYLRGPVTSSRILINGPMTGSNLWIRDRSGEAGHPMEGMGYGIFDRDVFIGEESVKESMDKTRNFEAVTQNFQKMRGEVEWVMKKIEDMDRDKGGGDRDIQLQALRGRIDRIESELNEVGRICREVENDVKILMSIIHK